MKKLYIVTETETNNLNDIVYENETYFLDYESACDYANYLWNHLTEGEKENRNVDVLYINIPDDLIENEKILYMVNYGKIDDIENAIFEIEEQCTYGTEWRK